jgi:hypothetical protein
MLFMSFMVKAIPEVFTTESTEKYRNTPAESQGRRGEDFLAPKAQGNTCNPISETRS